MPARKWQPGNRARPQPLLPNQLALMTRLEGVEVRAYYHQAKEEEEVGENINLGLYLAEHRNVVISLTRFTEEELNAFQQVINSACDRARKTVVERDRIAGEAFQSGDNTYVRSYRRVPVVIDRTGAFPEHSESLLRRSRRAPAVDVYPDRPALGDGREDDSRVAQQHEAVDLSSYDVPPTDKSEEVSGVGTPWDNPVGFLQSPDPWEGRAASDS